eukprot:1194344-Prorocentrum_minimum.AAC.4
MVVPVLHPTGGPCAGDSPVDLHVSFARTPSPPPPAAGCRSPWPRPASPRCVAAYPEPSVPQVHGVSLWRNTRAHHWSTGLWVYGSTSLRVYGSAGLRVYGHARPTSRPKLSIVAGTLTSMRALKQMKVILGRSMVIHPARYPSRMTPSTSK